MIQPFVAKIAFFCYIQYIIFIQYSKKEIPHETKENAIPLSFTVKKTI